MLRRQTQVEWEAPEHAINRESVAKPVTWGCKATPTQAHHSFPAALFFAPRVTRRCTRRKRRLNVNWICGRCLYTGNSIPWPVEGHMATGSSTEFARHEGQLLHPADLVRKPHPHEAIIGKKWPLCRCRTTNRISAINRTIGAGHQAHTSSRQQFGGLRWSNRHNAPT